MGSPQLSFLSSSLSGPGRTFKGPIRDATAVDRTLRMEFGMLKDPLRDRM